MTAFDLLTIGHSNILAARFTAMLRAAGADTIADVRSMPVSRFCPWFSAKNLAPLLAGEDMSYLFFGEELGGRPRDPSLYCEGTAGYDVADYEAMARQPSFQAGLERLLHDAGRHRLCLMCSEREPLDCHRCLLVARALAVRGAKIGHILYDGSIEPHATTEQRLLRLADADNHLFASGQHARLAAAYRRRSRAVAYRIKKAANAATMRKEKSR
ncbi:MAG TPA: DUF488 domain-containing protein [Xanthobacteraceae bacterium]|nr:DUF488 domain-containing protein [Xanthobacteraceae bacterium]